MCIKSTCHWFNASEDGEVYMHVSEIYKNIIWGINGWNTLKWFLTQEILDN